MADDAMKKGVWRGLLLALCLCLAPAPATAGNEPAEQPPLAEQPPQDTSSVSVGRRLLWYIPSRAADMFDSFRIRLRVGPGLGANFRATDYGAFFVGGYDSIYAGLPGPRGPYRLRSPVGFESLHGIVLAGVDATDDTRHGPRYGPAEVDLGIHLLLAGAELGLDIVEFVDFLGGFLFLDVMDDDFPRPPGPVPEWTSGIASISSLGPLAVASKPAVFHGFDDRLDYLYDNVHHRICEPLRATDAYFALDPYAPVVPPQGQFRLKLYTTFRQGREFSIDVSPDLELDVELPNLEKRFRLFIESSRPNQLPETSLTDLETQDIYIGLRKFFDNQNISLSAGIRTRWLPEAFVHLKWRPYCYVGKWGIRPEQRLFYESDDQFGALSSLATTRWIGHTQSLVLLQSSSVRYATGYDELKWGTHLTLAHMQSLLDERQRGGSIDWDNAAKARGVEIKVFGTDGQTDIYRLSLGFRGPLYKRWIFWELNPSLEWDVEEDYETAYLLRLGIDMLFWGRAYE